MNSLFAQLTLADVHQDVARNIVSLRESQDLFDDLTGDPAESLLAQKVEDEVKPPPYSSRKPIIDRPFEDAQWFNIHDLPPLPASRSIARYLIDVYVARRLGHAEPVLPG